MGMEIVTGSTGAAHVTPVDDAVRNGNSGYLNDNAVFDVYDKFAATIRTSNLVRIGSGYGMMQGRIFKIPELDYEELIIDNGSQGVKRCDLICARYSMSQQTGYEKIELVVLKGESGSSYVKPSTLSGNINSETKQADFPLYEIHINGITLESCTALFTVLPDGGRMGLIEKDLKEHKETSDPHRITFVDTGAGDVVNITSRESFPGIFKKIATAIKALVEHMANKENPHSVKGSQLADAVPISKGGTGATTKADARTNLGIPDVAAISQGGTGASTKAKARENLGIPDVLPISQGGTGATTAKDALLNLGIPETVAESATKTYVDNKVSTKANNAHRYAKTASTDFINQIKGDANYYGHVMLSDDYTGGTGAALLDETSGVAATPKAVYSVRMYAEGLSRNFQDGVDTIKNAITAKNVTPTASTPSALATAVGEVYTKGQTDAQAVSWTKDVTIQAYNSSIAEAEYDITNVAKIKCISGTAFFDANITTVSGRQQIAGGYRLAVGDECDMTRVNKDIPITANNTVKVATNSSANIRFTYVAKKRL